MRANKQIVLEALKHFSMAFEYASDELKKDKEFVIEVVKKQGKSLRYASDELKNDREVVLEALKQDPLAVTFGEQFGIKTIGDDLKCDKEFMLEAIKFSDSIFIHASNELKADREVVLAAVKRSSSLLSYLNEEIRNDSEICLEAIKQRPSMIYSISSKLKNDRGFLLEAVRQNGLVLECISDELRGDREVCFEALKQNPMAMKFVSSDLKNDREFLLEAVKKYGVPFGEISVQMEAEIEDKEILFEALKQDPFNWYYVEYSLTLDRGFIIESLKQNPLVFNYIKSELRSDRAFILEAIKANGSLISLLGRFSDDVQPDVEIFAWAYMSNPEVTLEVLTSRGIPLEAIKQKIGEIIQNALRESRDESDHLFDSTLTNRIKDSVLAYNNPVLSGFMQKLILEHSDRAALGSVIKSIALMQEGLSIAQQKRLITLHLLASSLVEYPENQKYKKIFKENYDALKDTTKLQPVLTLFSQLIQRKETFSQDQISKILDHCFIKDFKDEGLKRVTLIAVLSQVFPESLQDRTTFNSSELINTLIADLQVHGLIEKEITDVGDRFSKTFLSSRMPSGIFTYCSFFAGEAAMKEPLKAFIKAVLTEQLSKFRHEHNTHAHLLSLEQKGIWETSIENQPLSVEVNYNELDVAGFLRSRIEQGRAERVIRNEIFSSDFDDRSELERLVHLLLQKDLSLDDQLQIIDQILEVITEEIDFKNDLKGLKEVLQIKKNPGELRLADTENWQDLFLCGTEVLGSCQRIDGSVRYKRGLMGYCLDGKVRMLAIKNKSGKTVARALLKLLKKEGEDKAALFLEKFYPDEKYRGPIEKLAKAKALAMGLELYRAPSGLDDEINYVILRSLGNAAGVEYEDGGVGISDGTFVIKAVRV